MNITIAGDSFGCGVLETDGSISHRGLEKFLKDAGHQVVNVSQGGISNLDIWKRLKVYLERFPEQRPDTMLVFQSEWHRDFKHVGSWPEVFTHDDWNKFDSVADLQGRWLSRFYEFLSQLSIENNIPIYIIGGAGDTMWLDDMSAHYPGCNIACQSLTNLLINGQHRKEDPVFGCYGNQKESSGLIEHVKSNLQNQALDDFTNDLARAYDRLMTWHEHPEYFWPDGEHPNAKGHQLLYDFLNEQGILS